MRRQLEQQQAMLEQLQRVMKAFEPLRESNPELLDSLARRAREMHS